MRNDAKTWVFQLTDVGEPAQTQPRPNSPPPTSAHERCCLDMVLPAHRCGRAYTHMAQAQYTIPHQQASLYPLLLTSVPFHSSLSSAGNWRNQDLEVRRRLDWGCVLSNWQRNELCLTNKRMRNEFLHNRIYVSKPIKFACACVCEAYGLHFLLYLHILITQNNGFHCDSFICSYHRLWSYSTPTISSPSSSISWLPSSF